MSGLFAAVLTALFLTLVIEAAVVAFLCRDSRGTWLLMSIACNLATNPGLNIILSAVRPYGGAYVYTAAFLVLEVLAVLAEAGLYRLGTGAPFRRCMVVSAAANAVSMLCGVAAELISTV